DHVWCCKASSLLPLRVRDAGELINNGAGVVDASAPHASTGLYQRGPEARVFGQKRVGCKVGARLTAGQATHTFVSAESLRAFADEIDRAVQCVSIDHDLDPVAIPHTSHRTTGEGLRRDVTDAGSGGDPTETRVGEHRNMLAEWQRLKCGGDLIDLLHACTERTSANKHKNIAVADFATLDCCNSCGLGDKDLGGTFVPIEVVCVDERGIDGSALDDAAFGREIADGKADGRTKTA